MVVGRTAGPRAPWLERIAVGARPLLGAVCLLGSACSRLDPSQVYISEDATVTQLLDQHLEPLHLDFAGEGVTDEGLAMASELSAVRGLFLRGLPSVTDTGVDAIWSFHSLESVAIWNAPSITSEALARIGEAKRLDELILLDVPIDGRALDHVAGAPALEVLTLSELSLVRDEDLEILAGSGSLQRLNIRACPGISEQGVEKLRRSMPNCRIRYRP